MACHEWRYWACLEQTARQHRGLIVILDGLAPEGGEPQPGFIRAPVQPHPAQRLVEPLQSGHPQDFPRAAGISPLADSGGLERPAERLARGGGAILPNAPHHFCRPHSLKNLAGPLAEADSVFNGRLRRAVRAEVARNRARRHFKSRYPRGGASRPTIAAHTRYPLTLKGRLPFHLAGIGTCSHLQGVITLAAERLAHCHNVHLARPHAGLRAVAALRYGVSGVARGSNLGARH